MMRLTSETTRQQKGFSLIELMISLTIGMFLIVGVFTIYSNGRKTQDLTEGQTILVDDARFALETMGFELRQSGQWGRSNSWESIAGAAATTTATPAKELPPMPPIVSDCAVNWYIDLRQSLFASNNMNPYAATCIPGADYRLNTDVLVVKYAPGAIQLPDAALSANVPYLYSDGSKGELFVGPVAPTWLSAAAKGDPSLAGTDSEGNNYPLRARAYFVNQYTDLAGDNYPSLHRIDLAVGPSLANSMLIPGVEDLQVQFGVDTTRDGSVNTYVDADDVLVDPVANPKLDNVKSVQVWVQLRSRGKELLTGESQSVSIAGRPATTYADGYRRVVASTVVLLRNRLFYTTQAAGGS